MKCKDEDSEYLVDGIVDDLITEFSMIKELDICSRQSAFEFKGKIWSRANFSFLILQRTLMQIFIAGSNQRFNSVSGKRVRISVLMKQMM